MKSQLKCFVMEDNINMVIYIQKSVYMICNILFCLTKKNCLSLVVFINEMRFLFGTWKLFSSILMNWVFAPFRWKSSIPYFFFSVFLGKAFYYTYRNNFKSDSKIKVKTQNDPFMNTPQNYKVIFCCEEHVHYSATFLKPLTTNFW